MCRTVRVEHFIEVQSVCYGGADQAAMNVQAHGNETTGMQNNTGRQAYQTRLKNKKRN